MTDLTATTSWARGLQRTRKWATSRVKLGLARAGYRVTRLDEEGRRYLAPSYDADRALPPGTAEQLRADNPRLQELRTAYAGLHHAVTVPTQWNDDFLSSNLALEYFRGDNAYVWQQRKFTDSFRTRLYVSLLDIQSRDRLGLLSTLEEDGAFGAFTHTFGDRSPISRDLIDSVNEINYLDEQIGLTTMPAPRILDIGAGYGRLAHRLSASVPRLARYHCTDAIATSTFLCEFYTGYRQTPPSVEVVPLHEVDRLEDRYDLAVNIHSFSECSHAAVRWWLERVAERDVEWLLIIPNTKGNLWTVEADGTHRDFRPDVLAAGYELADNRPVHQSDEMRDLIGVTDEFFLFHRTD